MRKTLFPLLAMACTATLPALAQTSYPASAFFSDTCKTVNLAANLLKPLGGALSGNPILASNTPELVNTEGWLFQNPPLSPGSGTKKPISGNFKLYLYHANNSQTAGRFLHIIVTNPSTTAAVSLSYKGNLLDKSKPNANGVIVNGTRYGDGPSFKVSDNWVRNTFTHQGSVSIPPRNATPGAVQNNYVQIAATNMNAAQNVDGLFELNAGADCFVYVVLTNNNDPLTAYNLTQTLRANGKWRDQAGVIGETYGNPPAGTAANRYGRECGWYTGSGWSGETNITLPAGRGHLGLALNTDAKKPVNGVTLQDQTATNNGLVALPDTVLATAPGITVATRTYGNYGHFYDIKLNLYNTLARQRRVRLSIISNNTGNSYVGAISVNGFVYSVICTAATPRFVLGDWRTVPAFNAAQPLSFAATMRFYIPGLASSGLQLLVETLD